MQYDVYGDLLGLLGSHPVAPLVSLHHLDLVEPIFPHMHRARAIGRLMEAVKQDSASIIQQSICYDKDKYWSISVSWGYVVQVWRGIMSPRELEMPSRTFLNWYKRADYTAYTFNTRPVFKHPCQKPFIFYMTKTRYDPARRQVIGTYFRDRSKPSFCRWKMESPQKIDAIVVLKRPDPLRWQKVGIYMIFNLSINTCYKHIYIYIYQKTNRSMNQSRGIGSMVNGQIMVKLLSNR